MRSGKLVVRERDKLAGRNFGQLICYLLIMWLLSVLCVEICSQNIRLNHWKRSYTSGTSSSSNQRDYREKRISKPSGRAFFSYFWLRSIFFSLIQPWKSCWEQSSVFQVHTPTVLHMEAAQCTYSQLHWSSLWVKDLEVIGKREGEGADFFITTTWVYLGGAATFH